MVSSFGKTNKSKWFQVLVKLIILRGNFNKFPDFFFTDI